MDPPGTSISLSNLLCDEDESSLSKTLDDYDDSGIYFLNPGFVFEDEEEYVEILFKQEMGFRSRTDDCSTTASEWIKTSRVDAVDWIFNTGAKFGFKFHTVYSSVTYFDRFLSRRSIDEGKHWAILLLSVACLSLAAKMEERNVPPLSEFTSQEYHFEGKVIKKMELMILDTLEWKMGSVTPFAYLHYFFNKFCVESKSQVIVSRASRHIMALIEDANLIDHRPSIIASAAILAALDATLSRNTMDLRISMISSWGSIESELVFSCYNLIQEIERRKSKTPESNLVSAISAGAVENPLLLSSGAKRKLTFENSENCPEQKIHRT